MASHLVLQVPIRALRSMLQTPVKLKVVLDHRDAIAMVILYLDTAASAGSEAIATTRHTFGATIAAGTDLGDSLRAYQHQAQKSLRNFGMTYKSTKYPGIQKCA